MPNEEDNEITRSSISKATSDEEIGDFWGNHSTDEYWEQTYPVEFKVNLKSEVIHIHYGMEKTLSEQLCAVAKRRGMSAEKLLNLWVQEKLREEMT